jgi:hypothetical protein
VVIRVGTIDQLLKNKNIIFKKPTTAPGGARILPKNS